MPPITESQLLAQYRRARQHAGGLIDRIEVEFGFPPYLMYAIGSRETNFDPRYLREPGDNGNGHGWWQIDKRYHVIPPDWRSNISWQVRKGAEVLAGAYRKCKTWQGACSAYNSGRCEDRFTTGKDYGADVMARRAVLERVLGPRQTIPDEEDFDMAVTLVAGSVNKANGKVHVTLPNPDVHDYEEVFVTISANGADGAVVVGPTDAAHPFSGTTPGEKINGRHHEKIGPNWSLFMEIFSEEAVGYLVEATFRRRG